MTAHVHDPSTHGALDAGDSAPPARGSMPLTQRRWFVPGLVGAAVIGGLVVAGVLSLEAVLYIGLFGGMLLMHAGGHGHGGHGGGHGGSHGGSHAGHGSGGDSMTKNLRSDSSDAQPDAAGSETRLGSRAGDDSMEDRTNNDDQHTSHGCCG